ncbi:MAG: NAD-dependent epimerase/dehydratase family protein, partial [Oceanospirillales bacterium]|nr:NAD-dependent epimerase/dehydratase family protein [Oceanospirillales bacterium]
ILDIQPKAANLDLVQRGLSGRVEMITGDIRDPQAVLSAATDCDAIVHLAGLMTVDCAADPVRGLEVNLLGSLNLIDAA